MLAPVQPGAEKILHGDVLPETLGPARVWGWANIQKGGRKPGGMGLRLSLLSVRADLFVSMLYVHIPCRGLYFKRGENKFDS